jgi:hypothetical protein
VSILAFTILDKIANVFILLTNVSLYWFIINASCDHAFYLSKWLGIYESDYKALLIAGKLAWYKRWAFCILGDEWKSFLLGHHLFVNAQPDHSAFQLNKREFSLTINKRIYTLFGLDK